MYENDNLIRLKEAAEYAMNAPFKERNTTVSELAITVLEILDELEADFSELKSDYLDLVEQLD